MIGAAPGRLGGRVRQPVLRPGSGQPYLVVLMGQGLVDPTDDFRPTNPPANAAL